MRFLYVFFALLVMAIQPAQAMENRISVTDIHNFIKKTSNALNNPNPHVAGNFLNHVTTETAVFENRVSVFDNYAANPYADPYHRVWYNDPAYGYNYRYPLNPYYAPTSMRTLRKWDMINQVENKKRMIPGYQARLEITDTVISPYGATAMVDVDMDEYSVAYNPYTPGLAQSVLNASSKCKMYLIKVDSEMVLTRMDCNTHTNLPF